jgi:His/Glu/Gln/Arg/opine family amino acid ABC transporter permease subunit
MLRALLPDRSLLYSTRFRRRALQSVFVAAAALALAAIGYQVSATMARQGIAYGYDFLARPTGWNVSFGFVHHTPADTYVWTFAVGLMNTLVLGAICVVAATALGFAAGLAAVSRNFLLGSVASGYVALFRNVPALLQVFFWYTVLKRLPGERNALALGDAVFLSNRALYVPSVSLDGATVPALALALVGVGIAVAALARGRARLGGLALVLGGLSVLFLGPGLVLHRPVLKGFGFVGGGRLSLEFLALFIVLTIYSGAFVAEIVRGGLIAVDRGQIEAGRALGLPGWVVELKIRIPLALRLILPPLSNQYLFTMKLTSLGTAIGFSDLFAVTSIGINQTGQTIELLVIMVALYFVTNYVLALAMHMLNGAIALKTRP